MLQSQVNFLSLATAATAVGTILSLTSAPAIADSFNFAYSDGSGIQASGVLITDPYDPSTNSYRITSITNGQRNGIPIITLLAPTSSEGNDNLLIAADPVLDGQGFAYQAGDMMFYDAFNISPGGYFESSPSQPATSISFSITPSPTPVPEPSEAMTVLVMGVWIGSRVWGLKGAQKG